MTYLLVGLPKARMVASGFDSQTVIGRSFYVQCSANHSKMILSAFIGADDRGIFPHFSLTCCQKGHCVYCSKGA